MNGIKISTSGIILPSSVVSIKDIHDHNKRIAYYIGSNDKYILRGTLKFNGKANNEYDVYGIKIENWSQFCIVKDSNDGERLKIPCQYMILIPLSDDVIDLDDRTGAVLNEKIKGKIDGPFNPGDLVLVRMMESYHAAKIQKCGTICGITCFEIKLVEKVLGKEVYIVMEDVVSKLLNGKGCIVPNENLKFVLDSTLDGEIGNKISIDEHKGILRWKGKVNGLPCAGIENADSVDNDFSRWSNEENSYWIVVPLKKSVDNRQIVYSDRLSDQSRDDSSIRKDKHTSASLVDYPQHLCIMEQFNKPFITDESMSITYTIINALFVFNEMFDRLIFQCNSGNDIVNLMISGIVIPIRRKQDLDNTKIQEFSRLIKKKIDEGDKLIESFLKFIDLNFKMYNLETKKEEEIYLVDIKMPKEELQKDICVFLNAYCLEENMFILKPQKCLILRFPRKNASKVLLTSKLDITKITTSYHQFCSVCSSQAHFICKECSKDKMDITYFCKDHKIHCKHEKSPIFERSNKESIKGKIELELMAVLCQEKNEFYSYVKTIDVKENWMRFSANGEYREAKKVNLQHYFTKSDKERQNSDYKSDYDILEKCKYMAIYKYAPLEYYWDDF